MKPYKKWSVASLALTTSNHAFASQESASPLVSMGASLMAVIAIIVVLAYIAKRIGISGSTGNAQIKLVSQLAIGPREKICIIEVGEEWLVVGTTVQQMTLLSRTPRTEPIATPTLVSARPDFAKILESIRGRIGKR